MPFTFVIAVVLAFNLLRLWRKYKSGERASYDGTEGPVTKTDLIVASTMLLFFIVICAYEWLRLS